ncbi:MAG: hypothetical protein P4L64_08035 [Caulobacteraceae bacterium]|nr:hypothetical protein [Caulobacteraceae bacterium]
MSDDLMSWLGRRETTTMVLHPWQAQALTASLDVGGGDLGEGDSLPPLWQWLYFLETAPRSRIGVDGHPQKGGFMPPVPQPRRMFAGGRSRYARPLVLGKVASQTREILKIEEKTSGSGALVFVTVGYDYHQDGELCVREARDFVFLNPQPTAPAATPVSVDEPPAGRWRLSLVPDPVLLFRFSALTFNGHRIHYDTAYAQAEEGLAERVVHGPLTAILLGELVRLEAGRAMTGFEFRARKPFFVDQRLNLDGESDGEGAITLTASASAGGLMTARATLR